MPENKDFAMRIDILDECLRNRLRKWTLQKLVEEVNIKLKERYNKSASKRTIQNDIKYLIEERNAPIDRKKDGNVTHFAYLDGTFSIKNLPIQDEEIARLKDVINMLSQINDFQIVAEVEEIIRKLQNSVSTETEKSPSVIQFEKHTTSIGTEYIDNIFTAIKEKATLRISYQPFKAEKPEECLFHPYLLKEYRNRWFVIGRKGNADSITNFALDRIKNIKNSINDYMPNNLFDPEVYFNNLIGVTIPIGSSPEPIEIKVAVNQAPYIKTKPIHYTQEIIKEFKNGDVLIRLWLISNYELRSVLLSYCGDLEVIKPLSLRNDMQSILQKGVNCYK